MQLNFDQKISTIIVSGGLCMKQNELIEIEAKIQEIKQQLVAIGEMRPGSLTRQFVPQNDKKYAYYQISYTQNMKSHTEYVRKESIAELRQQIKNYRKFKKLVKMWVDLSIKYSKLKIDFNSKK